MSMQAKVGDALLKNLLALRAQKGGLNVEDVGALFEEAMQSLGSSNGQTDSFLRSEMEKLAAFIDHAKEEITRIGESGQAENATGDAALQLDAVIKQTEAASNAIMDAADAVQTAAAGIGGEKERQIMDAATKIYEACNFQDLTSQRITKVIALLNEIDARIHNTLRLLGGGQAKPAAAAASNVIPANFNERDLLNGPQLSGPSQDDIDALFASFKP